MAARTTCPSVSTAQVPDLPQQAETCVEELENATENLEQALVGLRKLAERPGYEFVDRLLTGYLWSVEQLREVNGKFKDQLEELDRKAQDPNR